LEIIEEEKLLDNVKLQSKVLTAELKKLEKSFPEIVSNIRNRGLFGAFDVADKDIRTKFLAKVMENGLIILPCGERSIRFRPVLDIKTETILEGFEIIHNTLKQVLK
jgi:L-lysine 6-transaminase